MPLPPVGPWSDIGSSSGSPLKNVLSQAMAYMEIRNRGSNVTRIENIPADLKEEIQEWGYTLIPKDSDYLYRTADLIHLKGNPYRSQRAACYRFIRAHRIRIAPYQIIDHDAFFTLFHRWVYQKEDTPISRLGPNGDVARMMLRDAASAHRVTLQEHRELGLTGRIVWVDGAVKAYTFGFPRSPEVFCVLLEVADRSVYGLAQYLFREFCREFQAYPLINTMDDSGLPALAKTKLAYHPCQLVPTTLPSPHK
ncbi:MAG: DUF2156 domain-containing protein [Nitrospirales bacterium]|nr:DUF2156 domain-containing protein [Nitrospirales bacterium]